MAESPPELASRLPRLGYGAANVGNLYRELSDEQASAVLDAAWDAGIRYFDTAPHYGLGLSERRLGRFLAGKPRAEFVLSTKIGRLLRPNPCGGAELDLANDFAVPADQQRVWDFSADGIRRSVHESLERMGLDRVDIVYLHDPERFDLSAALGTGIPAAVALRDEGVVSAIGVGSMDNDAMLAAVQTGELDLLMLAGRYTLLEQHAAQLVLPACAKHSTSVVVASVFNSGILASDRPAADARYEYGQVPTAMSARHRELVSVCHANGVELPAAALQFGLRHDVVRSVVVGAGSPEQITQCAVWMESTIPQEFWDALADRGLIG